MPAKKECLIIVLLAVVFYALVILILGYSAAWPLPEKLLVSFPRATYIFLEAYNLIGILIAAVIPALVLYSFINTLKFWPSLLIGLPVAGVCLYQGFILATYYKMLPIAIMCILAIPAILAVLNWLRPLISC